MNIENQFQAISNSLYTTNNEVQIVDLLVDTNNMFYNYSKNRVVSFIHDKDYHLVLFNAQENDRGFTMYTVENFCDHEEDLVLLRNIFAHAIHNGLNTYLMRLARSKVEDFFFMIDTFRALFNKPKAIDDYEVKFPTLPSSLTY
ncbi:MAG: hypothetical protein MUF58_03450 [Arcicella sp.]|jgi:hypothetical protein|nr:hypothetical protein [Arcicella sp.]